MTSEQRTRDLLAEALGLPASAIQTNTAVFTTPEWTSLAHMRIVLALEEVTGQPLGPEAIVSIGSFTDVEAILAAQVA